MVTRLGLQIPNFTMEDVPDDALFERVATLATTAEDAGFDSVWVMDHFWQIPLVGAPDEPMFEAYTLLGALAARTRRASLGALVTGVTYRNPALLAKMVTALDVLSSGRAILGIGAAWFEEEHKGLGFDFPPLAERFERLEEALQICRAMFTEDAPTFHGRHYHVDEAVNRPRPVRPGGPPILVGGSGERKTLRLVAQYADACNLFGDVPTVRHKLSVLDRHCAEVGRDPSAVTRTRLGSLAIGPTMEAAQQQVRTFCERRGIDESLAAGIVTSGDPDHVVEQVAELFDAGLDGVIFNMVAGDDPELVDLAGRTLSKAFG